MAHFTIDLAPASARIDVNGVDVSEGIESVEIAWDRLTVPRVALVLASESVTVRGAGDIAFQSGETVAAFLDSVDSEELEKAALARADYGTSLTDVMLNLLKEKANGT